MTITINNTLYGEKIYYRVKMHLEGGRIFKFWAQNRTDRKGKISGLLYVQCNRFGQYRWKGNTKLHEIVMAQPADIIFEKIGRMNLRYGKLEITGR